MEAKDKENESTDYVEVLTNEDGEIWVKGKNHPDNIEVLTLTDDEASAAKNSVFRLSTRRA